MKSELTIPNSEYSVRNSKMLLNKKGYIDLEKANTTGISGLNSYYKLEKITSFPYARVSEIPDFKNE